MAIGDIDGQIVDRAWVTDKPFDWAPVRPALEHRRWDWFDTKSKYVGEYRWIESYGDAIIWHAERPNEVLAYFYQGQSSALVFRASSILEAMQRGHDWLREDAFAFIIGHFWWGFEQDETREGRADLRLFFESLIAQMEQADHPKLDETRALSRCYALSRHWAPFKHRWFDQEPLRNDEQNAYYRQALDSLPEKFLGNCIAFGQNTHSSWDSVQGRWCRDHEERHHRDHSFKAKILQSRLLPGLAELSRQQLDLLDKFWLWTPRYLSEVQPT
jgi:hypothetical protein